MTIFLSEMCSWNDDYCWPGTCTDDLTKNCNCATGFNKVTTSGKTLCQRKHVCTLFKVKFIKLLEVFMR